MTEIPGYRIDRELGAGGMATVYLAVQESLDREVALKIMTPGLSVDETYCHRFLKEGRITAQLAHPNLLTVFDTGVSENNYYMASEYLPGGTARDRMKAGLSDPEVAKIICEVAAGLGYAHSKGFVHRDVKPGNLMFRLNGDCVLGDFGIAKSVDSNTNATKLGTSIGTPHYMSPEQAKGEKVDHRTDLYSLGVVFYELLTGSPPFDADDPFSVALMQINEPVPQLSGSASKFQGLIERLMQKDREQRFATAEEFIADLSAVTGGPPPAAVKRVTPAPEPPAAAVVAKEVPESRSQSRPEPRSEPRPSRPRQSSSFPLVKVVVGLTALVVLSAGSYWIWDRMQSGNDAADTTVEANVVEEPADQATGQDSPDDGAYATQMARARSHIAAGRFVSPPGSNAREVYLRILNLDPGNAAARLAVSELPGRIEAAAEAAWADGDVEKATSLLQQGTKAFPRDNALSYLLSQVEASAVPDVVEPDPEPVADPVSDPVVDAPAIADTPVAVPVVSADQARIDELTRLGDKYFEANIFSHPPGDNATDVYLQLLEIDAGNPHALKRLGEIGDTWASAARTNLRRGKLQIARRMIEKGLQASPTHEMLLQLQDQVNREGG